jgi:hypothetical protein
MDFTLNIKIEATPEFCKALDNIANTITAAFCVTAEKAAGVPPMAQAPAYVQDTPPAPAIVPQEQAPAPVSAPTPPPAPVAVPVATTPPAPAPVPTVPTTAQAYTQDQLALAASGLMDTGKLAELQQLLKSFGVPSLVQLPKEQYGAFATKLREMGAKI